MDMLKLFLFLKWNFKYNLVIQIVSDLQNYIGIFIFYMDILIKIKLCSMDLEGKKEFIDRMMVV